jgi:hypothetical protein
MLPYFVMTQAICELKATEQRKADAVLAPRKENSQCVTCDAKTVLE